jgi:hypothetical protein
VTRSSVGVQAKPAYVSTSTQVQPPCTSVSVQTYTNYASTSIQVDPKLPHLPSTEQTDDACRYMSLDVQSDAFTTERNPRHKSSSVTVRPSILTHPHIYISCGGQRRSLSPMDLGNTPYSQGCQSPQYWSPPERGGLDSPEYSPTHNNPGNTPTWNTWSPPHLRSRISTPQCSTPAKHHVLWDSQDASTAGHCVQTPSAVPLASTRVIDKHPTNSNISGIFQRSRHFVSAGVLVNFDQIPAVQQAGTNGKGPEVMTGTVRRQLYCFNIKLITNSRHQSRSHSQRRLRLPDLYCQQLQLLLRLGPYLLHP